MNKSIKVILLIAVISMILCFSFVLADEEMTVTDAYAEGYEQGFKDGKDRAQARTPIVRIQNPKEVPSANPGEILEFEITFKNESDYPAKNLIITPIIENDDVLVYERPLVYKAFQPLKAKKEDTTTFKIKINENAKKGTYPVKFKLDYTNSIGESFSREDTAYYEIISEKTKPILTISNIQYNQKEFKYGDRFYMSFDISNIGNNEAKEVEVFVDGFQNGTIMPQSSQDYAYIDLINGKASNKGNVVNLGFPLVISPNIEVNDVTLTIHVKYKGFDDKDYSLDKNIYITGIKVKEKESGEKKEEEKKEEDKKLAKPKIIISSYGVYPQNITAGEEFTFSFSFKNTSKDKDIRNIKITISSKEGAFIITKGSNTFYVDSLSRDGSVFKQIDLKAKQDLTSNSYEVHIDFDYEDYDGMEYQAQEIINVPVTEYSKVVINSATLEQTYVNNPTSLSFDFVNMGKAVVSNVTATVRGDFEPVQEQSYIGNIQAGNSDYFDIEVKPTKEGKNYGTLVLTYEDSSGKQIEVTRDFESEAFSEDSFNTNDEPIDYGYTEDMSSEEVLNFETWQIVLSGIGAFLVIFFFSRLITKKIIMKKFEDEI